MKIKICGINDSIPLACCLKNNVNFYGLVFYKKSQRNVSIKLASKLINYQTNFNLFPVGVFFNHNINDVQDIIKQLNLVKRGAINRSPFSIHCQIFFI